jgi:hypothetical protein
LNFEDHGKDSSRHKNIVLLLFGNFYVMMSIQVGCPMNYDILKEAIINIRKSAKCDKNVPISVVVISDRDWLIGGMSSMPTTEICHFGETIMLARRTCTLHLG